MPRAYLSKEKIDLILAAMKDRVTTYDYLAAEFNKNYYTVRDWVQQLIDQGLVRELAISSSRKKQFILTSENYVPTLRFNFKGDLITFIELADKLVGNSFFAPVGFMMSQLLLRSLNPEPVESDRESTQQYAQRVAVAGPYTNQELKKQLVDHRAVYKLGLETIEALIMNAAVWEEGPELATKAGGSIDPQILLQRARQYWYLTGNRDYDRDGNPVVKS